MRRDYLVDKFAGRRITSSCDDSGRGGGGRRDYVAIGMKKRGFGGQGQVFYGLFYTPYRLT